MLTVMFVSFASAQSLIAGKIYNSGFTEAISGARVTVTCNSTSLDTVSVADGTYAVNFDLSICNQGNTASVAASKGSAYGDDAGMVINSSGEIKGIINLAIKEPTPAAAGGGGGGGGGTLNKFYLCGNGVCDSGETTDTCASDCKIAEIPENSTATENEPELKEPTEQEGFFSGITGAVVGTLGVGGTIIAGIFIVAIAGGSVAVYLRRKKE